MNLSPSSSFSSSATAISYNGSSDFIPKGPTFRYLAGILRRMLCSRSLPTHPSDQITDSNSHDAELHRVVEHNDKDLCPGIVARLMGLDSLPELNPDGPTESPDSIAQSRSLSSVKSRGEESTDESSALLPTIPTYIELQDDEFFILSFEKGSEIKEWKPSRRKLKKRRTKKGESERSSIQKGEIEENIARRTDSGKGFKDCSHGEMDTSTGDEEIEVDFREKLRRGRKSRKSLKIKHIEAECNSEDSSPVSVLDFGEFVRDPEPTTSDDSVHEPSNENWDSSPRRDLCTEDELGKQPLPHCDSNSIDDPESKINEGSWKKDFHSDGFLWDEIRKILEREIVESNWIQKGMWGIEEFEGIAAELELQILDQMLDEVLEDRFS